MIALLCPTRERVDRCETMWRSAQDTAAHPEEIALLLYVDASDISRATYLEHFPGQVTVGPDQSIGRSWNVLASKAPGRFLRLSNDDEVFVTQGWDVRLTTAFLEAFPDGIGAVYGADGIHNGHMCTFPMLSRRVYELWGCFCPQEFEFFYHDTAIANIMHQLDRLKYVPEVLIDHQHWTRRLYPQDATTQRHREGTLQQRAKRDQQTFQRTGHIRRGFVEKLRPHLGTPWV